ncbi:MAG: hypothetical protein HRT43_01700, partial [Campylobacteraceae bacterium]|nr:hypothetical protein [Campylobacteraceae bacterium]
MTKKCILAFIINLVMFSSFLYSSETITIATNNYEPYTAPTKKSSGVILDIIKEVFQEINIDLKFVVYPWKRAELNVLRGEMF